MSYPQSLFFILIFTFQGLFALADEANENSPGASSSEFYHQAPANAFELTPTLVYTNLTINYKPNVATVTSAHLSSFAPSVRGEYGISSNYSFGAVLTYISGKTTYEPPSANISDGSTKGLADPTLFFYGHNKLGSGSIRYGSNLNLSLENSTSDANGDSNAASGGHTFTPYLGYELPVGLFKIGGQLAYDLIKGDRTYDYTYSSGRISTSTITSGQSLAFQVFGELPVQSSLLGLSLGYTNTTATKTTSNGSTSDDKNEYNTVSGKLYGVFPTGKITLLSSVAYSRYAFISKHLQDSIDSFYGWQLTAGARFTF